MKPVSSRLKIMGFYTVFNFYQDLPLIVYRIFKYDHMAFSRVIKPGAASSTR